MGGVVADLIARLGWVVDNKALDETDAKLAKVESSALDLGKMLRWAAGAAGVKYVIDQNIAYESQAATLKTVLGSAELAQDAIERLNSLAIEKTSFDAAEVIGAFTALSMKTLDASDEAILALGDLSASFGSNLEAIVGGISGAARGIPQALEGALGTDIRYVGDNLTFVLKGVEYTVARDARAIQDVLVGIGQTQFAGGMEAQAATLGGQIGLLKGQLSGLAVAFGQAMQGGSGKSPIVQVANVLQGMIPVVKKLGEMLTPVFELVSDVFEVIVAMDIPRRLNDLIESLGGAQRIGVALKAVLIGMTGRAVIMGIGTLVAKMKALSLAATIAQLKIFAIVAVFAAIGLAVEDLFQFFTGGESVIGDFVEKFQGEESFLGSVARGFAWLKSDGIPTAKALWSSLSKGASDTVKWFSDAWNTVTTTVNDAREFVTSTWNAIKDALSSGADTIGEKFAAVFGMIQTVINGVFSAITAMWDIWFGTVTSGLATIGGALASVASVVGGKLGLDVSAIEDFQETMASVQGRGREQAVGGVRSVVSGVQAVAGAAGITQTVGSVAVNIAGTTGMGSGEVSAAVERGVTRGLSAEVAQLERLTRAGA